MMPIKLTLDQRIILWFGIFCAEYGLKIWEDMYGLDGMSDIHYLLRKVIEDSKRHQYTCEGFRDFANVYAILSADARKLFEETRQDNAYEAYVICMETAQLADAIHKGWMVASEQFKDSLEDLYPEAMEIFEDTAGHCFYAVENYCKMYNKPGPDFDLLTANAKRRVL